MLCASLATAQLKVNSAGKVGIGDVEPYATLQVKDPTTAALWLQNGNGYKWGISNHKLSVYSDNVPNVLAICKERASDGGAHVPVMEFRQDGTYIHNYTFLRNGFADSRPILELDTNQWMMFNAPLGKAGLKFRESGSSSSTSFALGAQIYYDGTSDALILSGIESGVARAGLFLHRRGRVGIGNVYTGYTYQMVVYGDAQITGGSWIASDARYKSEITALSTEAAKLKQLRGVSYHKEVPTIQDSAASSVADPASAKTMKAEIDKKSKSREYGFLAQEVQQLYPDLVLADDDGYLSVNYNGFVPLLVESVKEQQAAIDALQTQNKTAITEMAALAKELAGLKSEIARLKNTCCKDNTSSLKSGAIDTAAPAVSTRFESALFQNTPNPFTETTQIQYLLPQSFTSADIYLYDMSGTQLDAFPLSAAGYGTVTINGGQLRAGLYLYALVVDGALIETKQMVLTK